MRRLRVVTATLVVVALLGACDDAPEPNIDPDPTPTVSTTAASASPSPTSSPTPEMLTPEQTVQAWINDWNSALHSGDTATLRAYEANDCRGCDELVGPVEDIYDSGGSFSGGDWSAANIQVDNQNEQGTKINVAVDVAPGSTVTEAGTAPTTYPASKHIVTFILAKADTTWKIAVIEVLS
jgi:hypothetical protein